MGTAMVYQWGSRSYAVDAQLVGETVAQITEREGYCPPSRLVAVASDSDSPLHSLFTWDDVDAAERWRTHEARQVIKSLTVTVRVEDAEVRAPAFVSVGHRVETQANGEGYRPLSVVAADPGYRAEALGEALAQLRAIQRRYAAIDALAPVWKALEGIAAD